MSDHLKQAIKRTIASFPAKFGLAGWPGEVFRLSESSSYFNDYGELQLYVQRLTPDGQWLDFAKGPVAEMRHELVEL